MIQFFVFLFRRTIFGALLAVVLLTVTTPAEATYFMKNVIWSQKSIEVCFADNPQYILEHLQDIDLPLTYTGERYVAGRSPYIPFADEKFVVFPAHLKAGLQKAVTYSLGAAGLSATGWRTCDETTQPQVVLVYSNYDKDFEVAAAGTTGDPGKAYNYGLPARRKINSIRINGALIARDEKNIQRRLRALVTKYPTVRIDVPSLTDKWASAIFYKVFIHELGHVLGLTHEYSRVMKTDRERYSNTFLHHSFRDWNANASNLLLSSEMLDSQSSLRQGLGFFGRYDFLSTMDYWWLYNIDELIAVKTYCEFARDTKVCDEKILSAVLSDMSFDIGYFSLQDVRTLRSLYLGEPYNETALHDYLGDRAFQNWAQQVRLWGAQVFKKP